MYQPKASAPEFICLDLYTQISGITGATEDLKRAALNLVAIYVPRKVVAVQDLADHGDYDLEEPTIADFISGAYVDKWWQYAYALALYDFCEDIP